MAVSVFLSAGCAGRGPETAETANTVLTANESAATDSGTSSQSDPGFSAEASSAAESDPVQKEAEEELEKELGAFEITAIQRELAKENEAGYPVLDAGRGNPNWINTKARYAFTRFMNFAIEECERTMDEGDMAGQAELTGIGARFDESMDPADETDAFLISAVSYCTDTLGLDKDILLKEWVDGIIGDYYPSPSRCLTNTEIILNQYLQSALYNGSELALETGLFPTEGGSAAMVYVFQALSHNRLLKPGDKIAIGTPIFTPYTQIPDVMNYGLVSIDVSSSEENNWDIDEEELRKLENPEVKAFFLVNPSNPASHALSENTLKALCEVVEKNPDLIDIDRLMSEQYGEDLAEYIRDSMTEVDFLNDLAQKKGVVVMYGPGFEAPDGTIRISLANLNKDDYVEIAERILELLDEYYEEYEAEELEAA